MPFKITYKGETYYSNAATMSSALSELGIARTASYQSRKISTEDYNKAVPGQVPTPTPTTPTPRWRSPETPMRTPTPTTLPTTTTPTGVEFEPLSTYTPAELYLPTGDTTSGYSQDVSESYAKYLEWLKGPGMENVPRYDIDEWLLRRDDIASYLSFYQAGYTQDQIDSYNAFQAFGSKYGNLEDYTPKDLADYLANYDQAQQQLEAWRTEAGPEATGFLDDQIREFYTFKDYQSRYGEPGDWKPVDIGDFFGNYETAQQQLGVWQQQAGEVEKYELEPGEAARRREESYEESRIAAGERYKEAPQYQPQFAQWLGEQGQFSGALEQFVESQYPSLRSEFQATQPKLTGFPTPGEARAEATQREQVWQGWLGGRTPELEQEYWRQRPEQRGERRWMQAPTMRTANW